MKMSLKSAVWLALLLSCLIALPPAVPADDTELFTTTANPNVLLMLDITGSMDSIAGGPSVGDLDGYVDPYYGTTTANSRMDILWKVAYTLLNADMSSPGNTLTGTLVGAIYQKGGADVFDTKLKKDRAYSSIIVSDILPASGNWSNFPSSGTARIGSGGTQEKMTYTSRSSGAPYTFFISGGFKPTSNYNFNSTKISYNYATSGSPAIYPENFPTNHSEAMSTDFLNNLTSVDEGILKARMGLMTFTTDSSGTKDLIDIRNQISSNAPNLPPYTPSYRDIWNSVTQYAYPSFGTPTAKALNAAQDFFNKAYDSKQICRQNIAVLITDGEDTRGGLDGATGNGYGPEYHCGGSFNPDGWTQATCPSMPQNWITNSGQVARNNAVIQEAANLASHKAAAKLFTVGVGISDTTAEKNVMREVLRRAAGQTNAQATSSQYAAVGASGDDASRGAGRAFFVTDAAGMTNAIRNVFLQINAGMYSFTAPSVASVRMTDRNYVYKASFSPVSPPATFWEGSLQAGTINPDNTITWLWDAGSVLKATDPSNRRIYTTDGAAWSRMNFDNSTITVPMLGVDNAAVRNSVVNYVRGYNHDNNAKLGDIFHSKPVAVGPPSTFYSDVGYSTAVGGSQSFADAKATRRRVVYVGTNDGMLHAFDGGTYRPSTGQYDGGTGEELFGYIPYNLLSNLEDFLPGNVTMHGYYVDASPRVADVWIDGNSDGIKQSSEWRTVLISGLRRGGNGYFALDVTDPPDGTDYSKYPKVLWEYTDSANVGQTWSEPFIGKVRVKVGSTTRDRWVAIFGGGVGSGNVGRSLVVLDIATGSALKTFTSADGIIKDIPASPTAVLDASGYIKFVYVADRAGSVYKLSLWNAATVSSFSASSASPPAVTGTEWTVNRIFQPSGGGQPAYHRVEAAGIDDSHRYLFFGTGNQDSPATDGGTGKFYAILDADTNNSLQTESGLADLSSSITSLSGGVAGGSGWFINLARVPSTAADKNTHSAEKVLSDPVVFFDKVYFTTYTPDLENPCAGVGIARLYGLQMMNAGAGLGTLAGEGSVAKVPYHGYTGTTPSAPGGVPSSPSLSIYPSGQSSVFVGFSTGAIQEVKIDSPPLMKTIKSWKEIF